MKLATLEVLSESEIKDIHEASLEVLAECGVQLGNERVLSLLGEKGLPIDAENGIVRFPRSCVEDSLSVIPPRFDVFDREGDFAFSLGDGESRIAAGHNAVFWVDHDTGERRPSTVADVQLFANICDRLERIDMIGIPVMPQDVPNAQTSLLHAVKACVEHSGKPIFFSTDNARINAGVIELLEAAFSGKLRDRAYGITQLSPTSPLFWEGNVLDALVQTLETGVPIAILPEPNAGVTCPYTLAGLLTMNNAECLSGLAMIQILRPGTKVMYANSWTTTDMRTGAACVGSTETTICRIAGAQLARFYRCPSHTTAPNSDNHAHDEQNAWEKALSVFCSVAAGNDLIVNCGMFATGMTCSHEQLIMDEEMSAMSKRIARGVRVDDDTIAKELIRLMGHRSSEYLLCDHTLRWLRSDEYLEPRVSVRGPFATWHAHGGKDTYELARQKVDEHAALGGNALPPDRAARVGEILQKFDRADG